MKKIAYIYPGQGSQFVGMASELLKNYENQLEDHLKVIKNVSPELLGIMSEGPQELLNKTTNTQPALFVCSAFVTDILKQAGYRPDFVAGHSLGEYSALYSAGVFDFQTGLKLVKKRAELMEKAYPAGKGSMAAVIGLEVSLIKDTIKRLNGVVEIANYNNSSQIVISGEKQAIVEAISLLKTVGAKMVVELSVSGPFHSSLMQDAAQELEKYLSAVEFNEAKIPVIQNVEPNNIITEPEELKNNLVKQVYSSVQWEQTILFLKKKEIMEYVECGAGKVLSGLIKRIDKEAVIRSIDNSNNIVEYIK